MRHRAGWLVGLAFFGILAAGCAAMLAELDRGAPVRVVALGPLLDKPAELRILHASTPLDGYGDTVSAVLVDFGGQRVSLQTGTLTEAPAYRGTLREFLAKAVMPDSFHLYELRGAGDRTVGYLLAREDGLEDTHIDGVGALVANATPVRDADEN